MEPLNGKKLHGIEVSARSQSTALISQWQQMKRTSNGTTQRGKAFVDIPQQAPVTVSSCQMG